MNTEKFWSMIEEARQQSRREIETQLELLKGALADLSKESIQEFDRILWMMMARAYRADLWEAASLVACGCSDDGFHEFQGWLIAQGQAIYESVLENPENLSDFVDKKQRFNIFEGRMTSIAEEAYESKTGQLIPESGYREKVTLVGRPLTPENERGAKFPRIVAKFGSCDDENFAAFGLG